MVHRFIRNINILPRWVIVFIDVTIVSFSAFFGYLLRFNFDLDELVNSNFIEGTLLFGFCGVLGIAITGSYKGIIRYTGLQDGVRIVMMVFLSATLAAAANLLFFLNFEKNVIPYSVVVIALLCSSLLLFNYRLLVKFMFSYYKEIIVRRSRVGIYGAGMTGIVTRHVIDSSPRMRAVCFFDRDKSKAGKILDGLKIHKADAVQLERMVKELAINELVITSKGLTLDAKNEIVEVCIRNQVKVRTVPPVEKWVRGELSFNQIKEINIDDLLGRESIKIKNPQIERDLGGKSILITGAAGSIGSELVRQVLAFHPAKLILLDQAESGLYEIEREARAVPGHGEIIPVLADITNQDRVKAVFIQYAPEIIFHAAAYKHVPMMEGNPSEAVTVNILGTKLLADLAVAFHVRKFVMISTDKAVNPTNVMGCSKRIAEIYVQSLNNHFESEQKGHTTFVTTRFGNVLGSNGSVIPIFKKQIKLGGPVTVTHPEITRYFMTIPEACQLVLEAAIMGKGGEIFLFDMGKAVKILDLAKKMIWLSGLEPGKDIDIVFTGLREGEKLFEELLSNRENTIPTHHEKIMIARVREYRYDDVNKFVELFYDLVNDSNELKMVALMKELVPEYKSNYSRYAVLDERE